MHELNQELPKNEIKVDDVVFLTPAKITLIMGGQKKTVMASVDIINRKVYTTDGDDSLSNLVFSHLDDINSLPEDFYMASDDVMQEASNAETLAQTIVNQDFMNQELIGENDE